MAVTYIGTASPDLDSFWDTFGGGSPGSDRNMINNIETYTAPVGGAILKALRRGMDSATSQAGGTVAIGLIDITGAAPYPVVFETTLNLRSDNAGYVWHEVACNYFMTAGHTYAVYSGKPSVQVWHTRGDATAWALAPATTSLSSSVNPNETGKRLIPLALGYELPTTTLTLTSNVNVGGTGYTGTTTGMAAVTSLTSATIDAAVVGSFDYSMLGFQHGVVYPPMGAQPQTASDGTDSSINNTTIGSMTGYAYVEVANPVNRGAFALGQDATIVAGDVIHLPASAGTLNPDTTLTDFTFGTHALWRRDASDGKMYSLTLTVSASGATIDASPSGVELILSTGTATATGSALNTPSGAASTFSAGAPTAAGSALTISSGLAATLSVGTSAATGSALTTPSGVTSTFSAGAATAIGSTSTAVPSGVTSTFSVGSSVATGSALIAPSGAELIFATGAQAIPTDLQESFNPFMKSYVTPFLTDFKVPYI